jgi:hypothetical protein
VDEGVAGIRWMGARIERMRWINCRSTGIWVRMSGGILLIYSGDVLAFKEVYRYLD